MEFDKYVNSNWVEGQIILDYFGGRRGRLCDIGASDGVGGSVSLPLIDGEWEGVLVEASYQHIPALLAKHGLNPRIAIVNAMVDGCLGIKPFWVCTDPSLSTASERLAKRGGGREVLHRYFMYPVPYESLHAAFGPFDVVSIDAEDRSIPIFNSIPPWALPKVVCLEYFDRSVFDEDELGIIEDIAKEKGYREFTRTGENILLERI